MTTPLDRLNKRYDRAFTFESILPSVNFYLFDWSKFVPAEVFDEQYNPSFTKASADVNRCRAFWHGLYSSLNGVSDDMDANDYNLFSVVDQSGETLQSVIQFVSMTKKQMDVLQKIASDILSDSFDVIVVNGDKTKGKDSERYVKDKLIKAKQQDKHVWIIASSMCQRSFSIADINVALLCYDNGDIGATKQRSSRPLTAGFNKKIGHIVSMSIDGNRDEKINTIILETAKQDAEQTDNDIVSSLKLLLNKTISIFQMIDGYVQSINVDRFSKELFESTTSHRLIVDRDRLVAIDPNDDSFTFLSGLNIDKIEREKMAIAFTKGQTYQNPTARVNDNINERDIRELIKENLIKLSDRIDYTIKMVHSFDPSVNLESFITMLDTDHDLYELLQCDSATLETLINEGYINKNLLSLLIRSK